jgi:hypothetical protein
MTHHHAKINHHGRAAGPLWGHFDQQIGYLSLKTMLYEAIKFSLVVYSITVLVISFLYG